MTLKHVLRYLPEVSSESERHFFSGNLILNVSEILTIPFSFPTDACLDHLSDKLIALKCLSLGLLLGAVN